MTQPLQPQSQRYVPGSGKRLQEEKEGCPCHHAEVAPKWEYYSPKSQMIPAESPPPTVLCDSTIQDKQPALPSQLQTSLRSGSCRAGAGSPEATLSRGNAFSRALCFCLRQGRFWQLLSPL